MTDAPLVREVRPGDLPRLRGIFTRSRRETFHWNDPEEYQPADFDAQTVDENLLLAELDGEVVGFVAWFAPQAFIHHLYVDSKWQRRGVGKALLDAALARMRRPAQLKCLTRNMNALKFYLSNGWKALETGNDGDGDFHVMLRE